MPNELIGFRYTVRISGVTRDIDRAAVERKLQQMISMPVALFDTMTDYTVTVSPADEIDYLRRMEHGRPRE